MNVSNTVKHASNLFCILHIFELTEVDVLLLDSLLDSLNLEFITTNPPGTDELVVQ